MVMDVIIIKLNILIDFAILINFFVLLILNIIHSLKQKGEYLADLIITYTNYIIFLLFFTFIYFLFFNDILLLS